MSDKDAKSHTESLSPLTPIANNSISMRSHQSCKYSKIKRIAEGTFGEIWSVIHHDTKQSFALKKIKEDPSVSNKRNKKRKINLLREGRKLRKLFKIRSNDPGINMIVKCHDILYDDEKQLERGIGPCIVMELCGYSLLHYMAYFKSSKKKISFQTIRAIAVQLLSAMRFMHNVGAMIHADLKPENICIAYNDCEHEANAVSQCPQIKIIDLGNAIEVRRKIPSNNYQIQTLWYRAPEVLLGNKDEISCAVDMWSIGCILCELFAINLSNKYRFMRMFHCNELSVNKVAHKIFNELCSFPVYVYNEVKSLNHRNIFPCYRFHHNEISYTKLKAYRKYRLRRKMGKERTHIKEADESQFLCFVDLMACLLDLNPFTRYSAIDAIQHEFIVYDFISRSKDINMQITPSNADSEERQKRINYLVKKYQLMRSQPHLYQYAAESNDIILKKQLHETN